MLLNLGFRLSYRLTLSQLKMNLTKPKGVTTQMKALDGYFLMAVFTLLQNRVHVFAIFMFNLKREKFAMKGLSIKNRRYNSERRIWNT